MTRTKQPHVLQKQLLASVKSKNILQMETFSNAARAWRNRACNVQKQQLSSVPSGGIGASTASDWRSSCSKFARSTHADFPGFPT